MTTTDRDQMIRSALTPSADVLAPADLGDAIYRDILATPQRRGLFGLGRVGWMPVPSPQVVALALLILLAVGLAIVALSHPPAPPILEMYHGGPDRTGVMPGPGPTGEPVIAWEVERPGPLPFNSMPLPVAGSLIVGDGSGILAALDVATGATLWERDVGSPIRASPALVEDLVLIGSEAGEVVAVRVTDGTIAWRLDLEDGALLAPALVVGPTTYAAAEGGTLAALDAVHGVVDWKLQLGGTVVRPPTYADGLLYASVRPGQLVAVDVAARAVRWRRDLGPGDLGSPALGAGRLFVGRGLLETDLAHDLVAIHPADGSIDWSYRTLGGEQIAVGGLASGRVFGVATDGRLYALNATSGELIWQAPVSARLTALSAIVGDTVYVTAEPGSASGVDARSGDVLWTVPIAGIPSMPSVAGGRLFVGTELGRVVAIAGDG